MKNSMQNEVLYNGEGHFSDEGIAFWIDCISENKKNLIPSSMINHLEECRICQSRIIEAQMLIDAINNYLPVTSPPFNVKHINRQKIFAAAAIIITLAAIAILFYLFRPQDNNDVFADYFHPYPDVITKKSNHSEKSDSFLMKGLFYYNYSVFDSAYHYFVRAQKRKSSDTLSLYLGVTYLTMDKTDEAISLLEKVSKQQGQFQDAASWYLALAYIRSSQSSKAETILSRMVSEHSMYEESAESILGLIKP